MSRQCKPGETVYDQFPIWEDDGYTKKSGETSFTIRIWKDGVVSALPVVIAEIGGTGEYKVTFVPNDKGFWMAEVTIAYNKQVWFGEYEAVVGEVDDIYEICRRIAGLSHENIFIDNTVYDSNTQLVSARVRIFDSKAHCDLATDGGSETDGLLASYNLDSVWEFVNQFKTFKQVRMI